MSDSSTFINGVLVTKAMAIANEWTAIGTIPSTGEFGTIGFSIVNTSTTDSISFNVSISGSNTPNPQDAIESNITLGPGGILERNQIIVNNGETLFVQASSSGLAVRLYGVTQVVWAQSPSSLYQELQAQIAQEVELQIAQDLQSGLISSGSGTSSTTTSGDATSPLTNPSAYVTVSTLREYLGSFNGFGGSLSSSSILPSTAWGYAYELSESGITTTLPETNGIAGQAIWFYPNFTTGSATINVIESGQFIYAPTCGLDSSNTFLDINAGEWICIMSRGNGEFDVVAGSWLNNHQSTQPIQFYAPINIPAATTPSAATQLGQVLNLITPSKSETVTPGNNITTLIYNPTLSEAVTITVEPGSMIGQIVNILSSAGYAITVETNVVVGSPSMNLPDGTSVYSYTLPIMTGASLLLLWNGVNWDAVTYGPTVVAPAQAPNQATNLGQLTNGSLALVLNGLTIPNAFETTQVIAASPATTQTVYMDTGSIIYFTADAANNWTLNITYSSSETLDSALSNGNTVTVAVLTTQGASPYYNSALEIDGTAVTPNWQGGTAPTAGHANGIDIYEYSIVKTASGVYTVLAAQTQF